MVKKGLFHSLNVAIDSPFPNTAFFRMSWEGFELPTFGKSVCRVQIPAPPPNTFFKFNNSSINYP
jgi:hypothetical protein